MRKSLVSITALVAILSSVFAFAAEPVPLFSETFGFATKTGFRGVFSWEAAEPVLGVVHYGTNAGNLDKTTRATPGAADTAGLAIVDGLTAGATYFWQVEDAITGQRSDISSFKAANAYSDWDAAASTYTIDLLVQLDAQALPENIDYDLALSNIAQGVSVFAERLYDALDGYARLGNVIVTDTNLDYAANVPNTPTIALSLPCAQGNYADVLVQTTVPFDSHTYSGYAISNPCVSFYVGRIGQLVVPWGFSYPEDLHFGGVSAHEMMHYAFNSPDLYDVAAPDTGCKNLDWDGSLMHNTGRWNGSRWELTELDRNPIVSPCDHRHDSRWSWQELESRYDQIPASAENTIEHVIDNQARGNEDGGALDIRILDREPGGSKLTSFTPSDANQTFECTADGPVVVDPSGDAKDLVVATPLPSEPALDILEGRLSWDSTSGDTTFKIKVSDLSETPPSGSIGEYFDFEFTFNGKEYYVNSQRDVGGDSYVLGRFETTRKSLKTITGSFDNETDTITAVLPKDAISSAVPGEPLVAEGMAFTGFSITSRRDQALIVPNADSALGSCPYTVGLGAVEGPPPPPPPPPPAPTPDASLNSTTPTYSWSAGPFTNVQTTGNLLGDQCNYPSDERCDNKIFDITVPTEGADFLVTITASDPTADFDLSVYDPSGNEVSHSNGLGDEHFKAKLTSSGIYRVLVLPFNSAGSSFNGEAALAFSTVDPEPDPEPVGDYEAEIDLGENYSWEGDPPVDANPAFTCASLVMSICDNTFIKVNVPVGGAKLTVKITANTSGEVFRLYVYDPSNKQNSGGSSGGTYTLNVTEPGIYRIGITTAFASGTYSGTVSLISP